VYCSRLISVLFGTTIRQNCSNDLGMVQTYWSKYVAPQSSQDVVQRPGEEGGGCLRGVVAQSVGHQVDSRVAQSVQPVGHKQTEF
jgi:hypothetical protein